MFTQPTTQLIHWQDFKVRNEVDIVLEIAREKGWNDCEIFGHGDMISQPRESKGWKLIPADLYEYNIPPEGVARVLQVMNAGVRIKGVIIADDERRKVPAPPGFKVSLPSAKTVVALIGKALLGLILAVVAIAIVSMLLTTLTMAIVLAPLLLLGAAMDYDPKLIILVDDGNGGTVWVSLLTWYE
jgi:hypothetical protein